MSIWTKCTKTHDFASVETSYATLYCFGGQKDSSPTAPPPPPKTKWKYSEANDCMQRLLTESRNNAVT